MLQFRDESMSETPMCPTRTRGKYCSNSVGMWKSIGMPWWYERERQHIFPFHIHSKLVSLWTYYWKKDWHWRTVTQFWNFNDFQLFLFQKTSVRCEFSGYWYHHHSGATNHSSVKVLQWSLITKCKIVYFRKHLTLRVCTLTKKMYRCGIISVRRNCKSYLQWRTSWEAVARLSA